jgi:hypothetical protein
LSWRSTSPVQDHLCQYPRPLIVAITKIRVIKAGDGAIYSSIRVEVLDPGWSRCISRSVVYFSCIPAIGGSVNLGTN